MAQLEQLTGTLRYDYDPSGLKGAMKDMDALGSQSGVMGKAAGMGMGALKVGALAAGVAVTGVGLAAAGAGVGLATSVSKAMDFEKGLSNIKAVSGATASEMDLVKEAALRIGAETSFSASEGAAAIEELVKAGVSVEGVLSGAADAAVALAAAGEVDMPTAAAIASAAMNNFGLAAENLPKVADLIAGAANASAISVEDFGYSLQASGAAANLAGFTFDDLSVAITAMGNAGIKGSDAGTSLKTFLMNLQPESKKQIALFKELGLTLEDGSNAFYDAQGNVKSMAEVAGILQNATKDLTAEQKTAALSTLFGSDAIRAAAVIAEQGADGMDALAASMGKVTAADVAKERLNNLTSSIDAFWGSLETLQIKAGLAFTPILKAIVDFGSSALNSLSPVLDQITPLIEGFFADVDVGAWFDDMFGGIDIAGMLSGLTGGGGFDLGAMFGGSGLADAASSISAMGGYLKDAFTDPAVMNFLTTLGEKLPEIGAFIRDTLIPMLAEMGENWARGFATALPIVLDLASALVDNLWPIVQEVFAFISDNKEAIAETWQMFYDPIGAIGILVEKLGGLQTAFSGLGDIKMPDVGGWLGGLFGGGEAEAAGTDAGAEFAMAMSVAGASALAGADAMAGLNAALADAGADGGQGFAAAFAEGFNLEPDMTWLEKIQNGFANTGEMGQGFADSLQLASEAWATFTDLFSSSDEWASGAFEGLLGSFEGAWNVLMGADPDEVGWIQELGVSIDGLSGVFTDAWASIQSGIDSAWAEFDATIQTAQDAIYSYLLDIWLQIPEDIRADLILIADHILEQFEVYRQTIEDKLNEAKDAITGWLGEVQDAWNDWLADILSTAEQTWTDVKAAIMGPLVEAKTELSTAWAQVEAEASAAWERVRIVVGEKINAALAFLSSVRAEIETRARDAWAGVVEAAHTALDPLVSAVTTKVEAALSYLTGVRDTVETKAREIWQGFIDATERALAGFKDAVITPVRNAIDNLKTAVTNAGTAALEIGRGIVDGIKRGIDARLAALKSSFWDSIRGIIDWLKGLLGIASPSTVARDIFINFMKGGEWGVRIGTAGLLSAVGDAVDGVLSAFDRLTTGDPGGGIADAISKMDALHAEWVRLQGIADEFNARDPLAGPITRMNQALTAFFDGDAAGSLMDLMKQMSGGGYTFDEGGLLERLGFSERSFEEIQQSLAALSGEPERQAKLWGDFIDGLMGDWERYLDNMKAPLEARKRELEAMKKEAERDPTRKGTDFDPAIAAVQAEIDVWDARNDAIQRALSGQEASVEGIADAYNRVLAAVEMVNGAAEDAQEAYQRALKAAQDAVKAMQDSAEGAEEGAHDQAMRLLDAELRAREKAHKTEMRQLEAHQKWTEADVDRRIAAEEKLHAERMKAITAEVDAEQKRLDAEAERIDLANEAIDRAKNLIATIEAGNTITADQAAFLRSMGIDPDQIGKVNAGLNQTKVEVDSLTLSIATMKGLLDKLPDEIGRVELASSTLWREFGRRPGSKGGVVAPVTEAEKTKLKEMQASGTLSKSDQRIVDVFLAGGVVQASRLRDILGEAIGTDEASLTVAEKKVEAAKQQVDLAGDLLAKLEAQLKVDEDQLAIAQRLNDTKRDGLAGQLAAEEAAFEAFKTTQAARVAAVEAEIDARKTAYDMEREAIAEAKQAEEDRHDARMRQIQEEYALELLKLGKTDAEVAAILEAQRQRAKVISDEAERRFREMLASAGLSPDPSNPFAPGNQPPPGIEPPGRPGTTGIGGAMEGSVPFSEFFAGAPSMGQMMADLSAAMAPVVAALPAITGTGGGGGGSGTGPRDLTNYGLIMVGDEGQANREFRAALLEFLGV